MKSGKNTSKKDFFKKTSEPDVLALSQIILISSELLISENADVADVFTSVRTVWKVRLRGYFRDG